jgi:hypothetical protein
MRASEFKPLFDKLLPKNVKFEGAISIDKVMFYLHSNHTCYGQTLRWLFYHQFSFVMAVNCHQHLCILQVEQTTKQIPRHLKIHSFYLANLSASTELGSHWWLFWKNDIDTIQEKFIKKYISIFSFCFCLRPTTK